MGVLTPHEALALRWAELCNDPLLHDIPGKIELNAYGTIELSPASTRHSRYQAAITVALAQQLPHGTALTECAITTPADGVRAPDAAWASNDFMARHGDITPLPQAPEICVEVLSPSNTKAEMTMKRKAYLAAGAIEVWLVDDDGSLQVWSRQGKQAASRYAVTLALKRNL